MDTTPEPPSSPLSPVPSSPLSSALDASEPAQTKGPSPKRRRRYTTQEKLEIMITTLADIRWNMKDFLSALIEHRGHHTMRVAQSQLLDLAYVDLPSHKDFEVLVGSKRKEIFLQERGWGWATETLLVEIKALAEYSAFGLFQPPSEEVELGSVELIKLAVRAIEQLAPQWLAVIDGACRETSLRDPQTTVKSLSLAQRTAYIYIRAGRGGVLLDTLNQLGLIVSYDTLQRRMKSLTGEAERQVRLLGQAPSTILTWDNFEFTEGRRGERTGDRATFRSITTALIVEDRGFEAGPLRQHMWHPQETLLSPEMLGQGLEPNTITIRLHHIESAIKAIFPTKPDGPQFPWLSCMPT
ncbi:MAG: hypothetical protein MMC33_006378, partial [Icmadophila ericetorum]|nr:hypothetical protein [Icmadophila ericetorum]